MNLDKIVLQVAVILTKLSIQYPVHLFIILVLISKQNIYVRKQNDNVMRREGGDSFISI